MPHIKIHVQLDMQLDCSAALWVFQYVKNPSGVNKLAFPAFICSVNSWLDKNQDTGNHLESRSPLKVPTVKREGESRNKLGHTL